MRCRRTQDLRWYSGTDRIGPIEPNRARDPLHSMNFYDRSGSLGRSSQGHEATGSGNRGQRVRGCGISKKASNRQGNPTQPNQPLLQGTPTARFDAMSPFCLLCVFLVGVFYDQKM